MSEAESDTPSYLDDQGSYACSDDGGERFSYISGSSEFYESEFDNTCWDDESPQDGEPLDVNAIRWEDMERSDELIRQIRATRDESPQALLSWKGNLNSPGTDGISPIMAALGVWKGAHFRTLYDLGGRAPPYTDVKVGMRYFCDDFAYPNPRAAVNPPDADAHLHRGQALANPADPIALHMVRIRYFSASNYDRDWNPVTRITESLGSLRKIVDKKCRVIPGGGRTGTVLSAADVVGDLALQNTIFGYPLLATATDHMTIKWVMRNGGGRSVNYVDTTYEELPLWSRYSNANIMLLCQEGWNSGHEVDLWSAPAKLHARNHKRNKGRRWTPPEDNRTIHITMLERRGIAHCGPTGLQFLEFGRYPPAGSVFEANNRATAKDVREWADPIWRLANYKVEPCKEIEQWEWSQVDLTTLQKSAEGREKEERKRQDQRMVDAMASLPDAWQEDYPIVRELVGEIVESCFELMDLDRQVMMELQEEADAEVAREFVARGYDADYSAANGARPTEPGDRMGSAFTTVRPTCPPCPTEMYPYVPLTQRPPWVPGRPTATSPVYNQLPVWQGMQGSWNPNYPPASPYPVYEATPAPPGYPGAATNGSDELQEGSAVSTPTPTTRPPASSRAREGRRSSSSHSAPSRSPFVFNINEWEQPKRSATPEAV